MTFELWVTFESWLSFWVIGDFLTISDFWITGGGTDRQAIRQTHTETHHYHDVGTSPTSHWDKSNFKLQQIQFHIGTNPISHWKKSNFTLEQISFHMW